jgi:hypothetical protein
MGKASGNRSCSTQIIIDNTCVTQISSIFASESIVGGCAEATTAASFNEALWFEAA